MIKIKVSVIIPTYNRAKLLDYTLDSLCKQSLDKVLYEVIVSDDGSRDNTKEIIENYKESLNISYLYQEDKGYRVALARNRGAKVARGEILVFLDSGML